MTDDPQMSKRILQKAISDREKHPWRYYRLDHDTMTRLLDELSEKLEVALRGVARGETPLDRALNIECTCRVIEKCERCEAIDAIPARGETPTEEKDDQGTREGLLASSSDAREKP